MEDLGVLEGYTTRAGGVAALTRDNAIGAWIAVPRVFFFAEGTDDYADEEKKGVWGSHPTRLPAPRRAPRARPTALPACVRARNARATPAQHAR